MNEQRSRLSHRCNGRIFRPSTFFAIAAATVAVSSSATREVLAFQPALVFNAARANSTSRSRLNQSTKDEAAPLSFDKSKSSAESIDDLSILNRFITREAKSNANASSSDNSPSIRSIAVSSAAALLLTPILFMTQNSISDTSIISSYLTQLQTLPTSLFTTYSTLLIEYPLPTKSLTSGALCGFSDALAQYRDETREEFNFGRWIRFAGKGCIGGIIWPIWYDGLDHFLNLDSDFNIYKLAGIISDNSHHIDSTTITDANYQWIRSHAGILTTTLSILIEQFIWCPIVFGTFEIPVSTLLNGGGTFSTIQKEVESKLGGLLVSNAKVWTLANLVIYNSPVEWRPVVANFVDILWQSIVSDVAADCGKVEDDICVVFESSAESVDDQLEYESDVVEKDYSFFAEKSRV